MTQEEKEFLEGFAAAYEFKFPILKQPANFTPEEKERIYKLAEDKIEALEKTNKWLALDFDEESYEELIDNLRFHPGAHLEGRLDKDYIAKDIFFTFLYNAEENMDSLIGIEVGINVAKEILKILESKQ